MTGFDLLLSNLFIGPIPMGVLSVAKTMPGSIIQLAATVNASFSPNLTIAYADSNDRGKVLKSLRFAMKCSGILVSIPMMVLCVYGENFYRLWVPSMDARALAILSFLTCAPYILFAGPQVLYNVYTTTNRLKLNAATVLGGGLLNVLVVLVLLKTTSLGIYAVAGVSSAISIVRNLAVTVPYTARLIGLKWHTFYADVAISTFCCLINGGVCALFQYFIAPENWMWMAVSVACSCAVCGVACVFILLNRRERESLWQKAKEKLRKNG